MIKNNCCSPYCNQYYPQNNATPQPKQVQCCCKLGIKRATEILGADRVRQFINFNAAAFITDFFLVGTELTTLGVNDNLGALTGSLEKLNPCVCDLLDISGPLAYPEVLNPALLEELTDLLGLTTPILTLLNTATTTIEGVSDALAALITALNALLAGLGTALSPVLTGLVDALTDTLTAVTDIVSELIVGLINILIGLFSDEASVGANAELASLCAIKAMAFEVLGDTPALQVANYNIIKEALRFFQCETQDCNPTCDDCCCSSGIMSELVSGNLTGRASLTAGSLVLTDVEILGCAGNALILGAPFIPATTTTPAVNAKIYVVCAEAVQFIG
ncbi:MAG: CotA family spore coat protein [Paeniclostridium sordellii]|nr:CotA family spore coat protein [Paeniclostridium sordellii]